VRQTQGSSTSQHRDAWRQWAAAAAGGAPAGLGEASSGRHTQAAIPTAVAASAAVIPGLAAQQCGRLDPKILHSAAARLCPSMLDCDCAEITAGRVGTVLHWPQQPQLAAAMACYARWERRIALKSLLLKPAAIAVAHSST
jgi:hypothetical protein